MPREVFDKDYQFLPHAALLSFEEIERLARIFVAHGVEKIRLTGGEPLLRKNIEFLIERLALLRTPEGRPLDITLTTNGSILARKAQSLKDAGLSRVTVSLDALDDALFRRMNDADFAVADVLDGIEAAHAAGLAPLKVNMVVKRGTNDAEIVPMARHFKGSGTVLRFIEYMDVGASNGWNMTEVLPSADVIARIAEHFPLAPARSAHRRRNRPALGLCGRRRRNRRDFERDARVLRRVHASAAVDRRQAVPLPLRELRTRPARPDAQRRERRQPSRPPSPASGQQRTDRYSQLRGSNALPLPRSRRAARRDVVYRRLTWRIPHVARNEITGVVLAGGRGSRMGGVDKGMQPFDGDSARAARAAASRAAGRRDC